MSCISCMIGILVLERQSKQEEDEGLWENALPTMSMLCSRSPQNPTPIVCPVMEGEVNP